MPNTTELFLLGGRHRATVDRPPPVIGDLQRIGEESMYTPEITDGFFALLGVLVGGLLTVHQEAYSRWSEIISTMCTIPFFGRPHIGAHARGGVTTASTLNQTSVRSLLCSLQPCPGSILTRRLRPRQTKKLRARDEAIGKYRRRSQLPPIPDPYVRSGPGSALMGSFRPASVLATVNSRFDEEGNPIQPPSADAG